MTNELRRLPAAQRTLPAMLQRQSAQFAQRPLLRVAARTWTHADAARAASRQAGALAQSGVARGDRVALMCGNRIEFLEVFLGAGWLGAVTVPVNTASMGPQIEYFLSNSQAKLLVIEAALLERLQTADLGRTGLQEIRVIGEPASPWQPPAGIRLLPYRPGTEPIAPAAVQPGDPLAILYTSGTTGPAKGVICPHAQYFWWGVNSAEVLGVGADDVLCTTLPLFHINALNTFSQAALTGAEVVFESRFSASGFWPSMRACGATVVYLLGAMVPILLAQPEGPAERDHRVRTGLGPGVPAAAGQAFLARTGARRRGVGRVGVRPLPARDAQQRAVAEQRRLPLQHGGQRALRRRHRARVTRHRACLRRGRWPARAGRSRGHRKHPTARSRPSPAHSLRPSFPARRGRSAPPAGWRRRRRGASAQW